MELREALFTRRSIRKFKTKPVEKEILQEIIELALWAPSGRNRQPWYFVVVQGEKLAQLKNITKASFSLFRHGLDEIYQDKPEIISATGDFFADLGNAPVVILAFAPYFLPSISKEMSLNQRWAQDHERIGAITATALVSYNISLLAHERGLGTCYMTGPLVFMEEISEIVGIKDKELICIMPVGYPETIPAKGPKRKTDVVKWLE